MERVTITTLTAEQQAMLAEVRDAWMRVGLCCEPADRAAAEAGVRAAYEAAGLEPPRLMLWFESPFAGAVAAGMLVTLARQQAPVREQVRTQVWEQVADQVWEQVAAPVREQVRAEVRDQVWDQVWAQVGDQVGVEVWEQVAAQVRAEVWDQVRRQVAVQVWNQVGDQVWDQVEAQVWVEVGDQVRRQVAAQVADRVRDQVWDQVWAQVADQVAFQVRAQVGVEVWNQVEAQVAFRVRAQVEAQVYEQVAAQVWVEAWDQVRRQVGWQVDAQVYEQVEAQVWVEVADQVREQVKAQVEAQVADQAWAQVQDQIRAQVVDQVRGDVREQILAQVSRSLWGQHDAGWLAWSDVFARLGLDAARRAEGLRQVARNAGWWWAFAGVAILTERPQVLRLDDRGSGIRVLHCADGPAVVYPDGWAVYAWRGTRVPADLIEDGWPLERIVATENTELRRCAIERYGWPRFLADVDARVVDCCPDPGNPGHMLTLYDLPDAAQVFDEPVRLLVMRNASRDRDGARRVFAESVPAEIGSAVDAAAWQFDVSPEVYAQLERAT